MLWCSMLALEVKLLLRRLLQHTFLLYHPHTPPITETTSGARDGGREDAFGKSHYSYTDVVSEC